MLKYVVNYKYTDVIKGKLYECYRCCIVNATSRQEAGDKACRVLPERTKEGFKIRSVSDPVKEY